MASAPTVTTLGANGNLRSVRAENEHVPKKNAVFVAALFLFLLLDNAIFRTSWYQRYIEPNSSSGIYKFQRWQGLEKQKQSHHLVAFLGDSRMMEGFSARLFENIAEGTPYTPVLLAIHGSSLRVWYYLLKQVDPDANKFDAIVVPLDTYSDADEPGDPNDRGEDVAFLAPFLSFRDSLDLMSTYTDPDTRSKILLGAVLKSYAYRIDLRNFLVDPGRRLQTLRTWGPAAQAHSYYEYPGMQASIIGVRVGVGAISKGSSSATEEVLRRIKSRVFSPSVAQLGKQKRYSALWLQRLNGRYRSGRLVLVKIPTDPIPRKTPLSNERSTVNGFSHQPNVFVVPENLFNDLEAPRYFFDEMHLNSLGRINFTQRLSQRVIRILESTNERTSIIARPVSDSSLKRE
jgi:hypothetical protein